VVRYYLGVSGEELLACWESGQYGDSDAEPGKMTVVMLLPFVRSREAGRRVLAARTEHEVSGGSGNLPALDALLPRERRLRGVTGDTTPRPRRTR
jgi:hypothetical protein